VRKPLLLILGSLFVLLLGLAAVAAWLIHGTNLEHERRIAALEAEIGALRAAERPDAEQACRLLEHHALTDIARPAMAVFCDRVELEERSPGVLHLAGPVIAQNTEQAVFGSGFATPYCLARGQGGWEVVGPAHELSDCNLDAEPTAAASVTADRWARLTDGLRAAEAQSTIRTVREALASGAQVPAVCEGLEPASGRAVALVDSRVWAGSPLEGFWRSVSSPVITACASGEPASATSVGCGLDEPWRYVLVLDEVNDAPPVLLDGDRFIDGQYQATLRLVDVSKGRERCARPVAVSMVGTVVLGQGDWLGNEYHQRIKAALCSEASTLSQGQVALDPFWACD
jgi:hypothetical protein